MEIRIPSGYYVSPCLVVDSFLWLPPSLASFFNVTFPPLHQDLYSAIQNAGECGDFAQPSFIATGDAALDPPQENSRYPR
jgi:hypothetical protein